MHGSEILLGVTGGIAAYKSADLASQLVQAGVAVSVVMTRSARRFIGATTFEALTNRPVHWQLFAPREHPLGEHIGLARPRAAGRRPASAVTAKFAQHCRRSPLDALSRLHRPGPRRPGDEQRHVGQARRAAQRGTLGPMVSISSILARAG
jgi:hypothetical protein